MSSQGLSQHGELSLPFIQHGFQGIDLSLFFIVPLVELSRPVFVQMLFIHQAGTDVLERILPHMSALHAKDIRGAELWTPDSFLPHCVCFRETSRSIHPGLCS